MYKLLTTLSIFVSLFFFLLTSDASAKVATMKKGAVEITKDEIINDDLFVFAETLDIEGTINGDVYAGGETVRINGTINGDLHVGTGTFYLGGKVRDDVYAGAGSVTVSGAEIGDSLLVGSGSVTIDESSTIGGSILAGAGSISIYAPVKRNVMVGAGTVDLNSEVGGEVRLAAGTITLGPATKIGKDFYYALGEGGHDLRMSESASVSGRIQKLEPKLTDKDIEAAKTGLASAFKTVNIVVFVLSLIGAYIVGYLCLKFFPKQFTETADLVSKSFIKTVGVGFLVTLLLIPTLLLLALTGVGIPLAGLMLLIFIQFFYLAKIVVSLSFGKWLSARFGRDNMTGYGTLAVGLTGIYLLKIIPVFGFFLALIVLWSGLGALVMYSKTSLTSK
ncbi:hypothetical protein A3A76_06005 [Candidatus Woesebacteria bacterium RIFCSPLOWO2_01_FULL_39_23]|uniref:DUF8173 domain-containing protein n=1 Tax=Candidatus Woesebacteria bacterium RIFCSPHIGHO2_01_FULL_40_22 TaxID=1802499 RepID=A0A1F7YHZ6_9BACT|nr:MAG: hypothetical protein A2141_02705 [Candidatus Woesebacteria bacterium RBG_16_40_11]OGM26956.1 MAG: hypothetical protein A2628_05950 [Candidatus Woesebacteria bacterium RIFCSPHIGHO2_01_FULL_40_22]OGM37363.1 MAG: hypothetical protein A3E41_04355 [Candidatus Woesebacteria bacterium RIFCSPHIGHO2_12_FULL_38_9]OGM63230.1 MAG: hypothetical protein A3A76_06005 [Candidatus Woesebacteria bacterium RIFCSPLOWO2_01_FULL_39_23]